MLLINSVRFQNILKFKQSVVMKNINYGPQRFLIETFQCHGLTDKTQAPDADQDATEFKLSAVLGSNTYGVCSNQFLDEEFQTIRYDVKFVLVDENTFSYEENTQIKIRGQEGLFDHTEKNTLTRVKG